MADITNLAQLKNAASSGGTYTIAPGTYTLDADLTFATDITITHDNTSGNVTIDGGDSYKSTVQDCTAVFTGQSDPKRIIFTQGDDHTILIQSTSAATTATFNYCNFTESNTINGLHINSSPAAAVNVTCNYCKCFNNTLDGFSLVGGTVNFYETLNLNNCDIYNNGTDTNDQGVTAHVTNQIINISGGKIYSNAGQGIAIVGSSQLYAHDVEIYSNGTTGASADIAIDGTAFAVIDGCEFHSLDNATGADYHISTSGGGLIAINNLFRDSTGSHGNAIYAYGGLVVLEGNIFDTTAYGNGQYAFNGTSGISALWMKGNVFYNVNRGIRVQNKSAIFISNIFHTISGTMAIYTALEDCYKNNKGNGYNYFYNCTHDFYDTANGYADQSQSTDVLDTEPQFMDAPNGDFRLRPTSPCLNTGKPTLDSGYTDIGTWQRKSLLR